MVWRGELPFLALVSPLNAKLIESSPDDIFGFG